MTHSELWWPLGSNGPSSGHGSSVNQTAAWLASTMTTDSASAQNHSASPSAAAAANTLATLGAVCWSIQLLPQIWINYRRHDTQGLQQGMMILWAAAGVPLGAYNIAEAYSPALMVQAQVLTALSLATWAQCRHYDGPRWTARQCVAAVVPLAAVMAGVEVALVYGLRAAKDRQLQWPLTLAAVLAAVLLAAGVLRHYWDIWVHRTVRGISFIFVGLDAAGDVFSLASVLVAPRPAVTGPGSAIDVQGAAIYATELALWLGIMAAGAWYNLVPWVRAGRPWRSVRREPNTSPDARDSGARPQEDIPAARDAPRSSSVFSTSASSARSGSAADVTGVSLRGVQHRGRAMSSGEA